MREERIGQQFKLAATCLASVMALVFSASVFAVDASAAKNQVISFA
jgi:hypothetical protein